MATTLPLSGDESTTLEEARDNDYNLLVRIRRGAADEILCDQLWDHREEIQALIAHHLRLERTAACLVQPRVTWEIGRFNICVLVETHSLGKTAKMIFRCQKEYQLGEKWFPGVAEEKVRVEAGTYAWIEEHCPEVRIPHLFAFGLKDGPQFRHRPSAFGFMQDRDVPSFMSSYMLLEYVAEGRILSNAIAQDGLDDPHKKRNLFKGLGRVMTSLARQEHDSIGSFRINDLGSPELTNRPMFSAHSRLESEGIPRAVTGMYRDSRSFLHHMLQTCEQAFRLRPNATHDEADCRQQMSHLALLRAGMDKLVDENYQGPHYLQLTDWNSSNFFVDDEWNILCIIDLEYINVLPPEMFCEPYWASVGSIDEIKPSFAIYKATHDVFLEVLEREELDFGTSNKRPLAPYVREGLSSGARWMYSALTAHQSIWLFVHDFIQPKMGLCFDDEEQRARYEIEDSWHVGSDSEEFVRVKLRQKQSYDRHLAQEFDTQLASRSDRSLLKAP